MPLSCFVWCTEVLLVELAIFGDWAAYNTLILGTSLYNLSLTDPGNHADRDRAMPLESTKSVGIVHVHVPVGC